MINPLLWTPEKLPVVRESTIAVAGRDYAKRHREKDNLLVKALRPMHDSNSVLFEWIIDYISEREILDGRLLARNFFAGFLTVYDFMRAQGEINQLEDPILDSLRSKYTPEGLPIVRLETINQGYSTKGPSIFDLDVDVFDEEGSAGAFRRENSEMMGWVVRYKNRLADEISGPFYFGAIHSYDLLYRQANANLA